MSRYIILVEREPKIVCPIVTDEEIIEVFDTLTEARTCASFSMICGAFPYQIIDLDSTDDES